MLALLFSILLTVQPVHADPGVDLVTREQNLKKLAEAIVSQIEKSGEPQTNPQHPHYRDSVVRLAIPTEKLASTRVLGVRTLHETGTSSAVNKSWKRADLENAQLARSATNQGNVRSYYLHTEPADLRPKAGYFDFQAFSHHVRYKHYGTTFLEFKREVLKRTTFTTGDSLDSSMTMRAAGDGSVEELELEDMSPYSEAQVWGPVDLRDVQRILILKSEFEANRALLESLNLEFGIGVATYELTGYYGSEPVDVIPSRNVRLRSPGLSRFASLYRDSSDSVVRKVALIAIARDRSAAGRQTLAALLGAHPDAAVTNELQKNELEERESLRMLALNTSLASEISIRAMVSLEADGWLDAEVRARFEQLSQSVQIPNEWISRAELNQLKRGLSSASNITYSNQLRPSVSFKLGGGTGLDPNEMSILLGSALSRSNLSSLIAVHPEVMSEVRFVEAVIQAGRDNYWWETGDPLPLLSNEARDGRWRPTPAQVEHLKQRSKQAKSIGETVAPLTLLIAAGARYAGFTDDVRAAIRKATAGEILDGLPLIREILLSRSHRQWLDAVDLASNSFAEEWFSLLANQADSPAYPKIAERIAENGVRIGIDNFKKFLRFDYEDSPQTRLTLRRYLETNEEALVSKIVQGDVDLLPNINSFLRRLIETAPSEVSMMTPLLTRVKVATVGATSPQNSTTGYAMTLSVLARAKLLSRGELERLLQPASRSPDAWTQRWVESIGEEFLSGGEARSCEGLF